MAAAAQAEKEIQQPAEAVQEDEEEQASTVPPTVWLFKAIICRCLQDLTDSEF